MDVLVYSTRYTVCRKISRTNVSTNYPILYTQLFVRHRTCSYDHGYADNGVILEYADNDIVAAS